LSDVEKIRGERRKAKANKSKYIGVGNDGMSGMSFEAGGGGRYGGFGSDSLGGGSSSFNGGSSYGNGKRYNVSMPNISLILFIWGRLFRRG
jgi:epsin